MNFRYARHTKNMQQITTFYTTIIGLEILGNFENHDGYDGVFLGFTNKDWHLEFTTSEDQPVHRFDDDDALVFYVNTDIELQLLHQHFIKNKIEIETSKNPYWIQNGIQISDPDGYHIILTKKEIVLQSQDELTKLAAEKKLLNWNKLLLYTQKLPYGRNENRADLSLILKENKGTCSSKHAFLKTIADLNQIPDVKLILGLFKMNATNTPKIKQILLENNLQYIPEAHCYLKIYHLRIDITNENSDFRKIENDIISEIEIAQEQVNQFKIDYHQNYLRDWLIQEKSSHSFEDLWNIREQCIKALENKKG